MSELTDEALVEALQNGDQGAVGPLFDRYYDELFAYADRFLGDPHFAADAVQESFLRVLRYGKSFRGKSSFRTWIFRVLRNVCLDLVKDREQHRQAPDLLPPRQATPPPSEPDPRLSRLRAAIESMPATRREVLVLRRFHGLSYAEISDICDISEGAARVRAHRALKHLEQQLSAFPETDDE